MAASDSGLPEPRTLFRSPQRASSDTGTPSAQAQRVLVAARPARTTLDLCSKVAVRRALGGVLREVLKLGSTGIAPTQFKDVLEILSTVMDAARKGAYEQDDIQCAATTLVRLEQGSGMGTGAPRHCGTRMAGPRRAPAALRPDATAGHRPAVTGAG